MKRIFTLICLAGLLSSLPMAVMSQNTFVGHVFYHNNPEYPLPEVNVKLFDMDNNLVASYMTDDDGLYQFTDIPDGEYVIKATTTLPADGITMQHALNIVFYLNGQMQFTPYQLMAADVTGNGEVNINDFLYIVVQYLVYGNQFPAGDWLFEDLYVSTLGRNGDPDTLSSAGTRVGETGGIWLPTGRASIEELSFETEDIIAAQPNEYVTVPLYVENAYDLNGFLMVLDYDDHLFEIVRLNSELENVATSINNGQIRFSWINAELANNISFPEMLAEITIKVRQSNTLHDGPAFSINPESHFIDLKGEIANHVNLFSPAIELNLPVTEDPFVISPNPASSHIQLSFVNEAKQLDVYIYNMAGQMVKSWQIGTASSQNSLYIGDLLPGIYQLVAIERNNRKSYNQRLLVR
jgi:hypothetical protein